MKEKAAGGSSFIGGVLVLLIVLGTVYENVAPLYDRYEKAHEQSERERARMMHEAMERINHDPAIQEMRNLQVKDAQDDARGAHLEQ